MDSPKFGRAKKLMQLLSHVEPEEFTSLSFSFLMVFFLMTAYYSLRPFRDALASNWTDSDLSFLWSLNFFASAFIVALYGWIVSLIPTKYLVPAIYAFFSLSFASVYIGMTSALPSFFDLEKGFYLWVSIFSLLNVSVFWSFMADLYSKDQAKRLFPIIGAGASTGALIGPIIPTFFVGWIGVDKLLLISASLLLPPVFIAVLLSKLKKEKLPKNLTAISGNPFKGFTDFLKNPYLFSIGIFIVLYTAISTFLYFEQKNLLEPYLLEDRTRILGAVDGLVNILSIVMAFFLTGRLVVKKGMSFTLSIIPLFVSAGFLLLAFIPRTLIVLALQVVRRAGNYAITRPAREMLFTLVNREDRFKAKPVIDVVFYRGGDMVTSWSFAGLTEGLGIGLSGIAAIGSLIAFLWGGFGIYLGRWFDKKVKT